MTRPQHFMAGKCWDLSSPGCPACRYLLALEAEHAHFRALLAGGSLDHRKDGAIIEAVDAAREGE